MDFTHLSNVGKGDVLVGHSTDFARGARNGLDSNTFHTVSALTFEKNQFVVYMTHHYQS